MSKQIRKKEMLVGLKGFQNQCDLVRKRLNKFRDYSCTKNLQALVKKMDKVAETYGCTRATVFECSSNLNSIRQLNRWEVKYGIREKSTHKERRITLVERMFYAQKYLELKKKGKKNTSYAKIAREAKVAEITVYHWVNDYKKFGETMLDRAIAFNRADIYKREVTL